MLKRIKVLIVDDSATSRKKLIHLIQAAPDMEVAGEAENGKQAIVKTHELRPDVIAMDLFMPEMDGLDATREIMLDCPTPIVIVTGSIERYETDVAFDAMQRGALAVHPKLDVNADPAAAVRLIGTLRAMAGVQVIHHWNRPHKRSAVPAAPLREEVRFDETPEIVVIASSTGGPAALCSILRILPRDFPVPVAIAQHITPDFSAPLSRWIDMETPLTVTLARDSERPQPGHVYIAPGDAHLLFSKRGRFVLDPDRARASYIPSGDLLLGSAAEAFKARAIGVVLTGMGRDGARGLLAMREAGAYTIAQDEKTCVVYGMPHEAAMIGAARRVLPLPQIGPALLSLVKKNLVEEII
jgi:two-component system chemotaxis response regulator CheB